MQRGKATAASYSAISRYVEKTEIEQVFVLIIILIIVEVLKHIIQFIEFSIKIVVRFIRFLFRKVIVRFIGLIRKIFDCAVVIFSLNDIRNRHKLQCLVKKSAMLISSQIIMLCVVWQNLLLVPVLRP